MALWPEILSLAERLGVKNINQLPGAWEVQLDDAWRLAVNAKKEPVEVKPDGGMAVTVQPYTAVVWFNGWLAGELPVNGDGWLAAGEAANEEALLAALRGHHA